jgi:hypothetical protein
MIPDHIRNRSFGQGAIRAGGEGEEEEKRGEMAHGRTLGMMNCVVR